MSNLGAVPANVRPPCKGTSRIVIDTSPNAAAGAARNATNATTAIFTGAAYQGCLRRLSASRPLIESLRVEERHFAGTFSPRSVRGVRFTGRCSDTPRPRDPLRRGRQPGDAELPLPPAQAGVEAPLRRRRDR